MLHVEMSDRSPAQTHYARVGEDSVAYQAFGDGPHEVLFLPGFVSNVEHFWDIPPIARIFEHFASYSRFVQFDKRGSGMSDPLRDVPTLDARLDDTLAVMDAAGLERAHIIGISEGGPLGLVFAATHPDRVASITLYGSTARYTRAPDYPMGWPERLFDRASVRARLVDHWEEGPMLDLFAPSVQDDPVWQEIWRGFLKAGGSPSMAMQTLQAVANIDVRDILPSVHAPALVIHRRGDRILSIECARHTAAHLPNCELLELEGEDHLWCVGDTDSIFEPIERFITGTVSSSPSDRVVATVLFTDIVDSTKRAAELGDTEWRTLRARHDRVLRELVEMHQGRLVQTTGDGMLATFAGPTRAITCAAAARVAVRRLGLEIRAGLHTGECELIGDDIAGIAVHIAARVSALAGAGEIFASSTVKDLAVGSPLEFSERGEHELKGVPGLWKIYSVG
jgi:class 3 adenylate cyclase/pimeloyl-ACP methyl ester carboxylesterase